MISRYPAVLDKGARQRRIGLKRIGTVWYDVPYLMLHTALEEPCLSFVGDFIFVQSFAATFAAITHKLYSLLLPFGINRV